MRPWGTRAGDKSWSANNEVWARRPPVSWIIVWMCCNHEDRIGVELAYKTGALHYLYRQFAIAQCQRNCSVCRLQEILFPVEVGDKSSTLEVLLKKNWFRYDIWLLKNSKRLKHKTKPSGNSRKQKLQNSIQLRKQVSQIVSSSVSEYDWLNNQITSVAREHKKDSMGEEKNKTRKKIQWGEEENCCPKSRDDLSPLDFEQYIQESAEILLQTTTLY